MSHHYSGPDYGFPHGDARLDLTDLYAFPKPGGVSKSILIMNVHPSFGVNPPAPTTDEPFAPNAVYELKIDTEGDSVADLGYRVRFSPYEGGGQTATLRRAEGYWKSKKGQPSPLGIAAALAGVDRFSMNGSGTRNTVFVMSAVSKGAMNERRTSRTEEL